MVAALAPDRYNVQFTVTRKTSRQAATDAGSVAALGSRRRSSRYRRSGVDGVVGGIAQEEARADQSSSIRGNPDWEHAVHPGIRQARSLGTRRRPVRVAGTTSRCAETGFLEFHHVIPFAAGGTATVDNLELRCRAHNAHEARECTLASPRSLMSDAQHAQLGPGRTELRDTAQTSIRSNSHSSH